MSNLLIANQKKFWSTGQLVPVSCVMDVKILLFISTYLVVKSKQLPCSLQPGEIYVTGNSLECYTLTYEWEKGENYTVAEKQVFVSEPEMISKVCESEANICMSMAGSDGVQPCVKVQLPVTFSVQGRWWRAAAWKTTRGRSTLTTTAPWGRGTTGGAALGKGSEKSVEFSFHTQPEKFRTFMFVPWTLPLAVLLTVCLSNQDFWENNKWEGDSCKQFYLRLEGRYANTCICQDNLYVEHQPGWHSSQLLFYSCNGAEGKSTLAAAFIVGVLSMFLSS